MSKGRTFLLLELFVKILAADHETACSFHWSLHFICKNGAYYCSRVVSQISFSMFNYKVCPIRKNRWTSWNVISMTFVTEEKGFPDLGQLLVWFLYIIVFNISSWMKNSQAMCCATKGSVYELKFYWDNSVLKGELLWLRGEHCDRQIKGISTYKFSREKELWLLHLLEPKQFI